MHRLALLGKGKYGMLVMYLYSKGERPMPHAKLSPAPKRPRGRPVTRPMAERIPDTPENIARAIFATPPKKALEWDYMKRSASK